MGPRFLRTISSEGVKGIDKEHAIFFGDFSHRLCVEVDVFVFYFAVRHAEIGGEILECGRTDEGELGDGFPIILLGEGVFEERCEFLFVAVEVIGAAEC